MLKSFISVRQMTNTTKKAHSKCQIYTKHQTIIIILYIFHLHNIIISIIWNLCDFNCHKRDDEDEQDEERRNGTLKWVVGFVLLLYVVFESVNWKRGNLISLITDFYYLAALTAYVLYTAISLQLCRIRIHDKFDFERKTLQILKFIRSFIV